MMKVIATMPQFGERLEFDLDAEAGALSGVDAERVEAMVQRWPGVGYLYGTQAVAAADPLNSAADMAVVLASSGWTLPESLAALLPVAEPVPDGAVP
jgi:hypothetical protein